MTSSAPVQSLPSSAQPQPELQINGSTTPEKLKVKISVPLDMDVEVDPKVGSKRQSSAAHAPRKLFRRDSLERREASLKGKEGSRQRRRWENDRLLNNPHAEPPLPSDWEIRPTYPRRTIPYYLAPLWDAAEFQRAIEAKLNASKRRKNNQRRRRDKNGSVDVSDNIDQFNVGISPMEEAASSIPKEIRTRLKHARSAKGLLQDLEEDVRRFVRDWNEQEIRLREQGLADAPLPVPKSLSLRLKSDQEKVPRSVNNAKKLNAMVEDEEDEEIVFVGRNGAMHDFPSSPDRTPRKESTRHDSNNDANNAEDAFNSDSDFDAEKVDHDVAELGSTSIVATEKLIFQALEGDKGASFARWLVHCVGNYYGLRTWSVTRDVGGQLKREAYVGVDSRARGLMSGGSAIGVGRCGTFKDVDLPQPLWGMV